MKTRRFLPLVASLFLLASPVPVFAGVEVDILSIDPRQPKIVLLQIDLNEALKQYEKALAQSNHLSFNPAPRPDNTGLTPEQIHVRDQQFAMNRVRLEDQLSNLRKEITRMLEESERHAKATGNSKRFEGQVKQGPQSDLARAARALEAELDRTHQPDAQAPDPAALLQGKWQGREAGREAAGKCTLEVKGNTVHFQGANPQEWYKATFILPDAPAQPSGHPGRSRPVQRQL